ncbi:MAG: SWIM zinc finger family protein [Lewinellaceae bacterium]|nr:SWIM zinc finger family protein [Saprospiraceae bacterium]MCB9338260.1 SWIM zinc finger family protein [Lewinellaceae bacterium]
MARNSYGVTWWGKQWLSALENIDYSNRLPIGRTYATAGNVRSIDVDGNAIKAKVKGVLPTPYRIEIYAPAFTENEIKRLVGELARNPALVAKILQRELPNELFQISEGIGLQLFPFSWKDFSMNCSCPDRATPCKHLAAVIFAMAEEIDKNPFLVFELHGLNLIDELKKENIRLADKSVERIPRVSDLLIESAFDNMIEKSLQSKKDLLRTRILDFTNIPDIRTNILSLYKPRPSFYDEDFREVLRTLLSESSAVAAELLDAEVELGKHGYNLNKGDDVQLVFDENLLFKYVQVFDSRGNEKTMTSFRPNDLVSALIKWDPDSLHQTQPSIAALHEVLFFSLKLVQQGAIMPQLLECAPGTYRIRWVPATMHESVKAVFDKLLENMPLGLSVVLSGLEERDQSMVEMLKTICSFFIGYCIGEVKGLDKDPLASMFLNSNRKTPTNFSRPDTAELLQHWLNDFNLSQKDIAPLVRVLEEEGQYAVEIYVEFRKNTAQEPVHLNDILLLKRYEGIKNGVLKDVLLMADFFPRLNEIIEAKGRHRLEFTELHFVEVLLKILPMIRLFGVKIDMPDGLKNIVQPQATILIKKSASKKEVSFANLDNLLRFEWLVALGGDLFPIDEFEDMVTNLNGIARIQDHYTCIDEDELIRLFEKFDDPPTLSGFDALRALFAEEHNGVKIGLSPEVTALRSQLLDTRPTALPNNLKSSLLPHQVSGYNWLMKNVELGFGSLIADEMGLGKTQQVLAVLLKLKEEGKLGKSKAMIVVPTSLMTNWYKAVEIKGAPLKAAIYYGQRRPLGVADPDIIVTSYTILSNEEDLLKKMPWHCIIIDEAQKIKNPEIVQAISLKSIPAPVKIAISSRPVEMHLLELWGIMDFLNHGYLGLHGEFINTFAKPIQREHDQDKKDLLHKLTAPFLLRRSKADPDIAESLPKRVDNDRFALLTPEQTDFYRRVLDVDMEAIYQETNPGRRHKLVMNMFNALRQICNHPHLFRKKENKKPQYSGKNILLFSLLGNIYQNGEKAVVFAQSKEVGDLLALQMSIAFGKKPLFLHGGTSRSSRDTMLEAFEDDPFTDTFIVSITAAGTALQLTAATHAIHYDHWWNPAIETHITDRTFNMGAMKNLLVWHLLTQGTFEEKLIEMIRTRKELASMNVGMLENWLGNLSDEDLWWLVDIG